MRLIKELYAYRTMIQSLVLRDLRGRYKGSVLGFAWTFINPLLQLVVYTLVFSVIMRSGIKDYYIYLFVALVPWIFFGACVSVGSGCIRAMGDMVKKIYFPREVIPIAFVTGQFINMLLSFIIVFAALIFAGKPLNIASLIYLPLIMVLEYFITLGMTLGLSSITVYWRDVEYFMGIISMAWQFMTPVMYGIEMVPEQYVQYFNFNPMTSIIVAYRDILYYGRVPELTTLIVAAVFGVASMFIGTMLFEHLQKHFAEEL
jgi:lipopolysaccharide transport system permease protein